MFQPLCGHPQWECNVHLFLNNQPDALITPILFCYKTLRVSGTFFAHQQEFSTVHSELVSFMPVLITASEQSQDVPFKKKSITMHSNMNGR
jgi:hypothetical protein